MEDQSHCLSTAKFRIHETENAENEAFVEEDALPDVTLTSVK